MLDLSVKIGPGKKDEIGFSRMTIYDGLGKSTAFLLPKEDAKLLTIMLTNPETWNTIIETMLPLARGAVAKSLADERRIDVV